jgi:hypothetical protein
VQSAIRFRIEKFDLEVLERNPLVLAHGGLRGFGHAFLVQGIRTEVLTAIPLHASEDLPDAGKRLPVAKVAKDPLLEVGSDIESANLPVGKREQQCEITLWVYCGDSWIHDALAISTDR